MEVKEKWLDGWTLDISDAKNLMKIYATQCHAMQLFGRKLFEMGAVFKQGGNFAIRDINNPNAFIVTAHRTNKGKLKQSDFVIVRFIHWQNKKIFVDSFNDSRLLSTDALLIGQAFVTAPELNVWVHFHKALKTPHEIKMKYPATTESEMTLFTFMIENKASVINLIDHDTIRKTHPNGQPDSVIVLGKDYSKTFTHIINQISQDSP